MYNRDLAADIESRNEKSDNGFLELLALLKKIDREQRTAVDSDLPQQDASELFKVLSIVQSQSCNVSLVDRMQSTMFSYWECHDVF